MGHIYGSSKESMFHFNTVEQQGTLYHQFCVYFEFTIGDSMPWIVNDWRGKKNKDEMWAKRQRFIAEINPGSVIVNGKGYGTVDGCRCDVDWIS